MTELVKTIIKEWENFMDRPFPGMGSYTSFEAGFKAALKPEHMKHTEEVRGLIGYCKAKDELLMCYRVGKNPSEKLFKKIDKYRDALKPFEKEGGE